MGRSEVFGNGNSTKWQKNEFELLGAFLSQKSKIGYNFIKLSWWVWFFSTNSFWVYYYLSLKLILVSAKIGEMFPDLSFIRSWLCKISSFCILSLNATFIFMLWVLEIWTFFFFLGKIFWWLKACRVCYCFTVFDGFIWLLDVVVLMEFQRRNVCIGDLS